MSDKLTIYEVGGSIRNELLGRPAKDRDYAVMAPSYSAMRDYLIARGATIYQERPQFVSIKAKLPELGAVDFTLARKESFYTDARHPDSVTPAQTIEEDLARRDFTMNAIAREVGTTTLIDPFCGINDIKNHLISCVGFALDRFREDRLRVFRAVRFSCQLNFELDSRVDHGIRYWLDHDFDSVSAEMVQTELNKAFTANTPKALELMSKYPDLIEVMVQKGIWLKPTLESK